MKKYFLFPLIIPLGLALALGAQGQAQPGGASGGPVRPIGVVTQIQPGSFTLHTDAGPELAVQLPEGVAVLRVPPGSKDLKSATKITVSDIISGDRVLVLGKVSADQKSLVATRVIVMSKSDLAAAQQAERLDWQKRGMSGVVKSVDPQTKEITISVPNSPPTPGNPTHPVVISLAPGATLLRYAPDSVKFSDARLSHFEDIKAGDQIRVLGNKNEDGSRLTAEKLVSGTFRNIGATVISVDAAAGSVMVKDLGTGKPVLVHTNADSKMHRLPPFVAMMIARLNSGAAPGPRDGAAGGAPGGHPSGNALAPQGRNGGQGGQGSPTGGQGRGGPNGQNGEGGARLGRPGGGFGAGPRDFNQMLDRTPPLKLDELKAGDALIVVSTEGANPAQVTAIVLLAGVEPILAAQPKGSKQMVLGQWNMGMGGADQGGGGEGVP
ncbi:MAG TPA: hypothetical protein VG028_15400 [Terriglobia bacterium]|nr:hypothetical protein [Terriglobia bacterium]